jgi:23S rRNA (cytosine1962-C5)-methyltransferase
VKRGHPWLYREALKGRAEAGEIVTILDRRGRFLARGIADEGPIAARLLTIEDEPIDDAFFRRRIASAAALRDRVVPGDTDVYRLLHGEGDRLAGVVCDVYGDAAVLRFDTKAIAAHRAALLRALRETLEARGVTTLVQRSGRGPKSRVEVLFGPPRDRVEVREHGMKLIGDIARGQKTGLFLDHRESRFAVRGISKDARVLNLYGYTGGFSVAAGLGGAREVVTVDLAAPAIELAEETWRANGLEAGAHRGIAEDARRFLEEDEGGWDLIVADPPSFAPRADALDGALEAYTQLHAACLKRLVEGGLYLAASCSSHVHRDAFDETVFEGARKARKVLQILGRWGAAPDHPRLAAFPEGDYLKVCLARVIG